MKEKKNETLDEALASIDKEFGAGSIFRLAEAPQIDIECIPTGILPLDLALPPNRGVPRGRIVEIFGPPQSGKTTIVLTTIAEAQRRGETCAFLDAEHAFDPAYSRLLGVNPDTLLVSQPNTGEEAFFTMEKLCRTGEVSVIGVDSVAALLPRSMIEGDYGEAFVGMHPKFMSQSVGKLINWIDEGRSTVFFINQLRESIGKQFGPTEYRPGGKAVPYYSSVGLDVRRIETLKGTDGNPMASRTRVKVVKNKTGIPYRTCEFDLEYGVGVPRMNCILDLALDCGLVTLNGSWFATVHGEKLGQGRTKALEWLHENTSAADDMEYEIKELANDK